MFDDFQKLPMLCEDCERPGPFLYAFRPGLEDSIVHMIVLFLEIESTITLGGRLDLVRRLRTLHMIGFFFSRLNRINILLGQGGRRTDLRHRGWKLTCCRSTF